MATAQVAGMGKTEYSIWRVIMASSVGTMIEWYDFYIFGSLAAILGPKFYPPGNETFAVRRLSRHICSRLSGAAFRGAVLRTYWRPSGAQVCVSGNALDHGLLDVCRSDCCRHTRRRDGSRRSCCC